MFFACTLLYELAMPVFNSHLINTVRAPHICARHDDHVIQHNLIQRASCASKEARTSDLLLK